ncbi:nucleotidyltransferase domain-containing protein [Bacillus sp. DJP31]|uniref:nucleotidyltransferase domain-containing protein n=1 Tax=Bacillus sp. DJP31 TaxID=3409789 RepID=UPI003BB4BC47
MKLQPIDAAKQYITDNFPNSDAAILAGSVVRGEATSTSDLDILVFDNSIQKSYRESLIDYDWPIELFVHNFESYKFHWNENVDRGRPSMPRMIAEGLILKDHETLAKIKAEAVEVLKNGPAALTEEIIRMKRYFITDLLDDLIGSVVRSETIYVANALVEQLHEFVLRVNRQWIGSSKWIDRSLRKWDDDIADQFILALEDIYLENNKTTLVVLTESILAPYGGRLFSGFSLGKE